ncbi:hypothetical protein [Aeoliella mucimassa]|nr:hypothetical protein [Aeoliella mucimassa]
MVGLLLSEAEMHPLLIALIMVGGGLWFVFVFYVLYAAGWQRLMVYRAAAPLEGEIFPFRAGRLGSVRYSGCLTYTVNSDGLGLSVFFLFRPFHPPLFVPWQDITARQTKLYMFFPFVELKFAQAKGISFYVMPSLADRLIATAGDPIEIAPK